LFFHVHGFLDHILFFDVFIVLAIYRTLPGDNSIGGIHTVMARPSEMMQMDDSDEVRLGIGEANWFLFLFFMRKGPTTTHITVVGQATAKPDLGAIKHMPENDGARQHHVTSESKPIVALSLAISSGSNLSKWTPSRGFPVMVG
jgi:hypothetical protein